jgi:hypothetical protein
MDCSLGLRIDWCEGLWCGSTYMVLRLSKISFKNRKKCIFCVFRPFLSLCRTAPQPERQIHEMFIVNWGSWKSQFFWVGHFNFFCFIPMKISQHLDDSKDFSKLWWLPWFPAPNNTCLKIYNTVYLQTDKHFTFLNLKIWICPSQSNAAFLPSQAFY